MTSQTIAARAAPNTHAKPSSQAPNQTLYITNLPDKLQKSDLRLSLYTLFSTYGPVLDVVALKTMKMRGQAHIVYRDIQASTQAMRALQGFEFFGKAMKIQYAKGKSDTISKLDKTYQAPTTTQQVATTELQQSIFNAPPSSTTTTTAPPPASSATLKLPQAATNGASEPAEDGAKSPQGVKRRREDESDEEGDAPMEEDDEGDAPMEDSSDED
ncbi:MAG: U2 snRNP complex subunit msl1 [Pycnora praestabilis]|nr:MAG: U2 snRNP complex subunit msl1 [Pycnora praestabilis]